MAVDTTRCDEAIDQLDAAIYSGDAFHSEEAIQSLETAMARWNREIHNIKMVLVRQMVERMETNEK